MKIEKLRLHYFCLKVFMLKMYVSPMLPGSLHVYIY